MSQNDHGSGNGKDARNPAITAAWIGAGAVITAALIAGLFTLISHNSSSSSSSEGGSSPPATSSTSLSSSQPGTPGTPGTTWLDQLTPSTGEVSKSDAAPDATLQGTAAPFSHELLIAPAENGNVITYALGGEYKTLNLEVATTGNASSTAGTSFTVDIDGTPFPLFGQTDVKDFFPGLTEPTMWIINVSGAQKLQLTLRDTNGVQGTSLLISGELDS